MLLSPYQDLGIDRESVGASLFAVFTQKASGIGSGGGGDGGNNQTTGNEAPLDTNLAARREKNGAAVLKRDVRIVSRPQFVTE